MERAGSAGTIVRGSSPEPITTRGNQGIHRIAQLANPRQVIQACHSAQHGSRGQRSHPCLKTAKNATVGTNQVHRLHAGRVGDSGELVQQGRFLKALYLYRAFWNQRKQLLCLSRAERTMAVEKQNVLSRRSCSINTPARLSDRRQHALFPLPPGHVGQSASRPPQNRARPTQLTPGSLVTPDGHKAPECILRFHRPGRRTAGTCRQ
jgi:hypothetical protein